MSLEQWQRVQDLFLEAMDLPETEREAFLQSACGGDKDLYLEVSSLITAPTIDEPPSQWFGILAAREPYRFIPGERVAGRYVVRRLVGRGGMGEVYEAWDEELRILIALKTLRLAGARRQDLQQLKLEGLLARAVWHPNVCRVYDLDRHDGDGDPVWFLTMEILHGKTLSEWMREQVPLSLDRVLPLAEQMAAGLAAAHKAGIVHRDFKPGNVMLVQRDGKEQAVVTDFGTARVARQTPPGPEGKGEEAIVGTPAYMAPEQVLGQEVGPAADIYALGVVLYQLVTGRLPFTAESGVQMALRRLEADPPAPRTILPELDPRWDVVIRRCLARNASQRFRRVEDVAAALLGSTQPGIPDTDSVSLGRHTLPPERDSFVGREPEIEELEQVLSGSHRLVTLLGAGGMGKTRFAAHYAWRDFDRWPGGVWFCDLTEARDLNGIASAVAASLGVPLQSGDPLKQLGHAIAGRGHCLMIFDNFEQVAAHGAESLGRWLAQASDARFLVTSRERLGVDGERIQPVEPLTIETAVELFEARARGLRPGVDLGGAEGEAVAEIARLVDGMPLAIELAAARVRVMSATAIVNRMRNRFQLLTGGRSAHHETLRGAIDGSWELLTPWEKAAWAQCSVFEGGFTLAAAEAVVDLSSWPEAPWMVDVIQSLVDQSLLRTTIPDAGSGPPEPRFGMYVSLQEYARMKIVAGDESAVELRHGRWYAGYGTEETIENLDTHGGIVRWHRLEQDLDNLMAACRRALGRGDHVTAVAAYRAAWGVLRLRGPFGAAIELALQILKLPGLQSVERADVLRILGMAEAYSGIAESACGHLEEALAVASEARDRRLEGRILSQLGQMHHEQRRLDEALRVLTRALEVVREVADQRFEGIVLNMIGMTYGLQGRLEEAQRFHETALVMARKVGDWRSEGATLSNLGLAQRTLGASDKAAASFETALAIHREAGNRRSEGIVLLNLGALRTEQGLMAEARAHLEAALSIFRATGARRIEGVALTALGELFVDQEQPEEARAFLEAGMAIHREIRNRRMEPLVIGNYGRLFQVQGKLQEARSHFEAAVSLFREHGDRANEATALMRLGSVLTQEGSLEAAGDAVRESEEIFRQLDASRELGRLFCVRAELESRSGNRGAALRSIEEARQMATLSLCRPESDLGRMIARAEKHIENLERD